MFKQNQNIFVLNFDISLILIGEYKKDNSKSHGIKKQEVGFANVTFIIIAQNKLQTCYAPQDSRAFANII